MKITKNKIIQFGEIIEGPDGFAFPVLNEREIRAAAGILFLFAIMSFMNCQLTQNFTMLKYMITAFFADMSIRVFINPRFSPSLIAGRFAVRNQTPEYVGAKQKKFAWSIGVLLAGTIFVFQVLMNAASPITGIACLICLTFLFFEAAFGICLGCKFYPFFFKEKPELCPGEVCELRDRTGIQKITPAQVFVFCLFLFAMLALFSLQSENFKKPTYDLFGVYGENF